MLNTEKAPPSKHKVCSGYFLSFIFDFSLCFAPLPPSFSIGTVRQMSELKFYFSFSGCALGVAVFVWRLYHFSFSAFCAVISFYFSVVCFGKSECFTLQMLLRTSQMRKVPLQARFPHQGFLPLRCYPCHLLQPALPKAY